MTSSSKQASHTTNYSLILVREVVLLLNMMKKTIILHLIIYEFFSFESDDDSRLTLKNK